MDSNFNLFVFRLNLKFLLKDLSMIMFLMMVVLLPQAKNKKRVKKTEVLKVKKLNLVGDIG